MEVRVEQTSVTDIETPLLVVNLFEGITPPGGATGAVDQAMDGLISRLIADGEVRGELGSVTVIHTTDQHRLKARRVAVVGLGKQDEFDLEAVRLAAAYAARKAWEIRVPSFATIVHGAGVGGLDPLEACRATVEGSVLALYRYEQFKEATKATHEVTSLTIVERNPDRAREFTDVASLAKITCDAVALTRDLSVGPSNYVTPAYLAQRAREIAQEYGLEITVWEKEDLRQRGMNAILAVSQGSAQPPVFVIMRYRTEAAKKTLAVVGKGITFDTGGISLKPSENMEYMRHDKSGAAAVIGFMQLAAASKLPVNVIGIFAAVENMPSGTAYRPGDVIKAYNGKTIEIANTDAEGRVLLADALAYAAEQKPDAIIDLATLTGACVVALGNHATGVMGNNQRLIDLLVQAGERSGDRCWPLPLWKPYHEQIKTVMADVRNTGGRRAGAITAARFLMEFVGDLPWAHLDIAGSAYTDREQAYIPPYHPKWGATGVGVRLLWHFCQAWKDL